jgi:3-oxoacyl-[acyl-carrier-protein] synthase III
MTIPKYTIEYIDYTKFDFCDALTLALDEGISISDINIMRENGLQSIPVSNIKDIDSLIEKALMTAINIGALNLNKIKTIFLLHSLPGFCLPNSIFSTLTGLKKHILNVPIVPISGQPCSIFHYGIQLAIRILECSEINSQVALIGVDLAPSHKSRFFFGSAMGDSLITAIISSSAFGDTILATYTDTNVIVTDGEDSPQKDIQKFRNANPFYIREAIEKCLSIAKIQLSDIAWIIPHTPYLKIKDIIGDIMKFPKTKILTNYISETGHLNSNDSFSAYKRLCNDNIILQNDICLLVNPGFGGTRGVTIIRREQYRKNL